MASLFRTDNTQEFVSPRDGKGFTREELNEFIEGYCVTFNMMNNHDVIMITNGRGKESCLALNKQVTTEGNEVYGNAIICLKHELNEQLNTHSFEFHVVRHGDGYRIVNFDGDSTGCMTFDEAQREVGKRVKFLQKWWQENRAIKLGISKIDFASEGSDEYLP